jgi:site-specific recombinase XerD
VKAGPKAHVLGGLTKRSIHHYWNRLKETADLSLDSRFTPHIMRHEFLSRLADQGLNAAVLQQLARHATMVTTQRYIHVSGRELVAAIAKLEYRPPLT